MIVSETRRVLGHLRDFGPAATLRTCAENLVRPLSPAAAVQIRTRYIRLQNRSFDRRHGTSTAQHGDPSVPAGGQRYEATDEASFAWFLRRSGVAVERTTFLDIGSGRGKVALMAARAGFRRVIGVEYDRHLVSTAEANLAAYRRRGAPGHDRVRLVQADATTLSPPAGELLVWLFNPLDGGGLAGMLERFEESWRAHPRRMVFGYYNALHPEVFARPWLECAIPSTPLLIGHLMAFRNRLENRAAAG